MTELIPTIGIETHVQLATKSKLFCSCSNDARQASPNTLICPVCLGLPGTLPVLNQRAVELAIRAGLALNAVVPAQTKFDRKNYFYPDLPKGYQITQLDQPIVGTGRVEFPLNGQTITVGITRAHMEEDAGKLVHPSGADYSLVDYNRAGTPLMEVVSEPDLHSAAEAKAYAQEIYNLMRYAKVSDANLYYGNMRFDVNVSLAPKGQLGTRTETKNLNSFKAVERAVEYEIKRQSDLIGKGQKIAQETRGWDEAKGQTFSQRSKEEAHDYRYFPEPDLPPVVTKPMLTAAMKSLITPNSVRKQLSALDLPASQAEVLVGSPDLSQLFLETATDMDKNHQVRIAGWLTNVVLELLAQQHGQLENLTPSRLQQLSIEVDKGELSSTAAKSLLSELLIRTPPKDLEVNVSEIIKVADELHIRQVSDSGALDVIVDQVIAANPGAVTDYRAGKEQAHKFLVGQVMKASQGQANPPMVNAILKQKLQA